MGRPRAGLDDYLDWQERLNRFKSSGMTVEVFCDREGFSRTTFFRWVTLLRNGIPESIAAQAVPAEKPKFLPLALKASPLEIELPNGGLVRLPPGVDPTVAVEVIQAVGALRPGRKRKS